MGKCERRRRPTTRPGSGGGLSCGEGRLAPMVRRGHKGEGREDVPQESTPVDKESVDMDSLECEHKVTGYREDVPQESTPVDGESVDMELILQGRGCSAVSET